MKIYLIAVAACLLKGCGEPTNIVVPEPIDHTSGRISYDGFGFRFPVGLKVEGALEECPSRATECPLGDDSTHLVWRAGDVRFDYVLDHYGGVPMGDDWGERITVNGMPAFRKHLPDGATRYLITNHAKGAESARVALWKEEEEPIFWGTCRSDAGCEAVLQTLATVGMRSAAQDCAVLFPKPPKEWVPPPGYKPPSVTIPTPKAPRQDPADLQPPAPPPPPAPRPPGAEEICQKYLDAD
ncbi:MAG: hypothetical protein ACK4NZ_09060 [Tsuneonella sp.]